MAMSMRSGCEIAPAETSASNFASKPRVAVMLCVDAKSEGGVVRRDSEHLVEGFRTNVTVGERNLR